MRFNKPSCWLGMSTGMFRGKEHIQEQRLHSKQSSLGLIRSVTRRARWEVLCHEHNVTALNWWDPIFSGCVTGVCSHYGVALAECVILNGYTGCLKWVNMAVVPPPVKPTQLYSPAAFGLPRKLAGTDTNRLFIVQLRQVGRQGSQAANIDKEQGRDRVAYSKKTWMRASMQHLGHHMKPWCTDKLCMVRNGWQKFQHSSI